VEYVVWLKRVNAPSCGADVRVRNGDESSKTISQHSKLRAEARSLERDFNSTLGEPAIELGFFYGRGALFFTHILNFRSDALHNSADTIA